MNDLPMPSLEVLCSCSDSDLQSMELKALDLAAQAHKRAEAELKLAVAMRGAAEVYRFLIENRQDWIRLARAVMDGRQGLLRFPAERIIGEKRGAA